MYYAPHSDRELSSISGDPLAGELYSLSAHCFGFMVLFTVTLHSYTQPFLAAAAEGKKKSLMNPLCERPATNKMQTKLATSNVAEHLSS